LAKRVDRAADRASPKRARLPVVLMMPGNSGGGDHDFFDQHLKKMMCAPSFVDQPPAWVPPTGAHSTHHQAERSLHQAEPHHQAELAPSRNMRKIESASEVSTRSSDRSRDHTPAPTAPGSGLHGGSSFPATQSNPTAPVSGLHGVGSFPATPSHYRVNSVIDSPGGPRLLDNPHMDSRCSSRTGSSQHLPASPQPTRASAWSSPAPSGHLPPAAIQAAAADVSRSSSSAGAWNRGVDHNQVTEWNERMHGADQRYTPAVDQKKTECVRCFQKGQSYFDHACPKCGDIVCFSCLEDFRLILHNYRCPSCGEYEENQAALRSEMWMLNTYRNSQRAWTSLRTNVSGLFSGNGLFSLDPCAGGPTRRHPLEYRHNQNQAGAIGLECQTEIIVAEPAETPGSFGRPPSPPRPPRGERAEPDHQTRPPVAWSDAPGAALAAGLFNIGPLAPPTSDLSQASTRSTGSNGRPRNSGSGGYPGAAASDPWSSRGAQSPADNRGGHGPAHQTRLPYEMRP